MCLCVCVSVYTCVYMCMTHAKILQGLMFTIFCDSANSQNFHFAKCSPLNETRLLLNKITFLTTKSFDFKLCML